MDPLLAFRPVHAVHRLPRGSRACPLSLRHVLAAPGLPRGPVPFVLAPSVPALRGALAAAREARAVVILRCPRELDAARWFDVAAAAAHDLAPGHPYVAAAEIAVEGPGEAAVERAGLEAARLVDAGLGHLAIDASGVPPAERAAAAADVAALASDRELGIELVLAAEESARPEAGAALLRAFRARGVEVDLARATFVRPAGEADARAQARALVLLARDGRAGAARGGATTPELLGMLAGSPVRACDDGGAVLAAAMRARGDDPRAEALAWSEATAFLDALGAAGSARALAAEFQVEA
jgi:hypothetical protein